MTSRSSAAVAAHCAADDPPGTISGMAAEQEVNPDSVEFLGLRFSLHPARATLVEVARAADGSRLDQIHLEDAVSAAELAAVAADWVAAKLGVTPPAPTSCAACSTQLAPVAGDSDRQFDGALHVAFSGGYGMFVDPVGERLEALLCSGCAQRLAATHPFVARLLDPYR